MRIYRSFQIKWYHLLFGLLGLLVVGFVLLYVFSWHRRIDFAEDETDLVG